MEINEASSQEKLIWNQFVRRHFPAIGAFMQTWEWGEFQRTLGRGIGRYFLLDKQEPVAAFTLVHHRLPLGFSYGYLPRGPVIAAPVLGEEKTLEIFKKIRDWAFQEFPRMLFLRLEPPVSSLAFNARLHGFRLPSYYIQPRHNVGISLSGTEEEIIKSFHPSTRSNIHRAENRGVETELKQKMTENDLVNFSAMIRDTIERNSGKDAFPGKRYFNLLLNSFPLTSEKHDPHEPYLGIFCGYQNKEPAAMNLVLFFGDTATYLYGASHTDKLSSKVTTYLHWSAMREAKKRGLKFYDLGGIDEARWPTLTNFKRQFRGKEFSYIGNMDVPIRPYLHCLYNIFRKIKKG